MTNDSIITNNGKKILLNRGYTATVDLSTTQYLSPTQFKVGISGSTPSITFNDLTTVIPIANGTVLDTAQNTWSGSIGAIDSTDNTTTYKQGANQSDVTAQNLLSGTNDALKLWEQSSLSGSGLKCPVTDYAGFWLYIKDATALAKISSTSGSALQLRLGDDSSNYYYKNWSRDTLAVGWNWRSTWAPVSGSVGTLSKIGTPATSGSVDYAAIAISGSEATSEFTSGEIIYDLLRSWDADDTKKDFQSGWPTFNYSTLEVEQRCYLTTIQASGFLIDSLGIFNKDSSELMASHDVMEDESKSDTDEFAFVAVDRII